VPFRVFRHLLGCGAVVGIVGRAGPGYEVVPPVLFLTREAAQAVVFLFVRCGLAVLTVSAIESLSARVGYQPAILK